MLINHLLNPGINNEPGAGQAWGVSQVERSPVCGHSVLGCKSYGVCLGVNCPLARAIIVRLMETVRHATGSPVVTYRDNSPGIYQHGPNL